MAGSIVAKIVIAVVAFPLFGHVIYSAITFVLGLVLPLVVETDNPWSETVRKGAVVGTVLVAARISFGICRRLWPSPRIVNPDAQIYRAAGDPEVTAKP